MAEERREYEGIEIVVRSAEAPGGHAEEEAGPPGLFVDGRPVAASVSESTGRLWHWRLPYREFESPIELGEAIVDHLHLPGRES